LESIEIVSNLLLETSYANFSNYLISNSYELSHNEVSIITAGWLFCSMYIIRTYKRWSFHFNLYVCKIVLFALTSGPHKYRLVATSGPGAARWITLNLKQTIKYCFKLVEKQNPS